MEMPDSFEIPKGIRILLILYYLNAIFSNLVKEYMVSYMYQKYRVAIFITYRSQTGIQVGQYFYCRPQFISVENFDK